MVRKELLSHVNRKPSAIPSGFRPRFRPLMTVAAVLTAGLVLVACGSSSPSSSKKAASQASNGKQASNGTQGNQSTASQSGDQGPALTLSACCSFGSISYNAFNPDFIGLAENWILMPLATEDYPSLTSFTPGLASAWSVQGDKLTVDIRPGVHWQDGKPVTSTDLYDTVILDGTNGTAFWNDITDVSAPSSQKVVFTLRKGESPVLAEDDLFSTYVLPASVYGRFVTPALKADELSYFAKDDVDPTAAAKMPAEKAISQAFTKLSTYHVGSLIGNGPFELKNVTTAEAHLVKWSGYYKSSDVHVSSVNYYDEANQDVYPLLTSGTLDFTSVELPPSLLQRWKSTPGAHIFTHPTGGLVIPFNDSKYPLNQVKVRQALAYVIPRTTMADDAYGTQTGAAGSAEASPDGLPDYLADKYLTSGQIAQLNKYPLDDAKAASLLESAGFHKKGSQWVTPTGQPFTLTLDAESGASDVSTAYSAAAAALSSFGIKTSVDDVAPTTLTADLLDGNFAAGFTQPNDVNPLDVFSQMLGPSGNFAELGKAGADKGIGFGPDETVPGLGKVNVSQTIAQEAATTPPGSKMDAEVWDWARLVNQQVPYLWYATKVYQLSYSTSHFTDWPATSSPLWDIMAANRDEGLVLALTDGYVRPTT